MRGSQRTEAELRQQLEQLTTEHRQTKLLLEEQSVDVERLQGRAREEQVAARATAAQKHKLEHGATQALKEVAALKQQLEELETQRQKQISELQQALQVRAPRGIARCGPKRPDAARCG